MARTKPPTHAAAQSQGRLRRCEPSLAAANMDADRMGCARPPPIHADWASRDSPAASFGFRCLGSEPVIAPSHRAASFLVCPEEERANRVERSWVTVAGMQEEAAAAKIGEALREALAGA